MVDKDFELVNEKYIADFIKKIESKTELDRLLNIYNKVYGRNLNYQILKDTDGSDFEDYLDCILLSNYFNSETPFIAEYALVKNSFGWTWFNNVELFSNDVLTPPDTEWREHTVCYKDFESCLKNFCLTLCQEAINDFKMVDLYDKINNC